MGWDDPLEECDLSICKVGNTRLDLKEVLGSPTEEEDPNPRHWLLRNEFSIIGLSLWFSMMGDTKGGSKGARCGLSLTGVLVDGVLVSKHVVEEFKDEFEELVAEHG